MTDDTTLRFVSSVHPYDSLAEEALFRTASAFRRISLEAGEQVYRRGDTLEGLYLIEDGEVEVVDAIQAVRGSHLCLKGQQSNQFGTVDLRGWRYFEPVPPQVAQLRARQVSDLGWGESVSISASGSSGAFCAPAETAPKVRCQDSFADTAPHRPVETC